MTPYFLILLCMWGMLTTSSVSAEDSKTIRIAADEWAPMTGRGLLNGGFSVQLTQEMLIALGYSVSVDFMPWKRIMGTRRKGRFDIVTNMWKNKDREMDFQFSNAYIDNKLVFVSRKDQAFVYSDLTNLKQKRIGIVSYYAYPEMLLSYPKARWQTGINIHQNIKKLLAKRLDIILGTEEVIRYESRKVDGWENLHYDSKNPMKIRPLHIAINRQFKNHKQLALDINRMITIFKQNGRFQQLKALHGLQ